MPDIPENASTLFKVSKQRLLSHKYSSSLLLPGKKNTLWSIVKCGKWSTKQGATKHWWHQNPWAKSPLDAQNWKRDRSKKTSGTFFWFALVGANLRSFCANLCVLQPFFNGWYWLKFAMTNSTNWTLAQRSQPLGMTSLKAGIFAVSPIQLRMSAQTNQETHTGAHLETRKAMEPMQTTGRKPCLRF